MKPIPFRHTSLCLAIAFAVINVAQAADTELSEVTVSAADASAEGLPAPAAGGQVASGARIGILGNQALLDTPFSVTSYTAKTIQDKQAASVGEVLLNEPAVRVARGFGNFQQVYLVRGLPIFSDDISYNGLYGLLPRQYLAAELIERVDVLKGANAFLNGAAPGGSGVGGAINIVPKRAPNYDVNQVTLGTQTGGEIYGAGDFARRFNDDKVGVRMNIAKRDGDSAVKGESRALDMATIGTDYRGDKLRVSADIGFQNHELNGSQPNITIAPGVAIPKAPDASRSIAQPWTNSIAKDVFATLRAEYDFLDNLTGWVAAGTRQSEESGVFANPTVNNANGDSSSLLFINAREDKITTGEAGLRWRFATGKVKHVVTTSLVRFDSDSKNAFAFGDFAGFANNIYNPTVIAQPAANAFLGGVLNNPKVTEAVTTSSIAVADSITLLDDRLIVTFGARRQTIENSSFDATSSAQTASYKDSAVTPIGGVVYKLSKDYSLYANYIEGLVKGDTAPAMNGGNPVINAGQALAPFKTKQIEAGLKFDNGTMGGAVGIYQSEKPVSGFNTANVFGTVSDQTFRGLEVTAYGRVHPQITVLGGLSLLDSENNGKDAIGAPKSQANVGAEWMVPGIADLVLESRVIHTSSQFADAANTQKVPSWTRVDLGARYLVPLSNDTSLTLRGRLDNIADKDYYASVGGFPGSGYLTLGAPRTLTVSASYDF